MKPYVDNLNMSKVELCLYKCYIEVLIGILCFPFVFMAQAAMIFPILYMQYLRLKWISSFFTKVAFKHWAFYLRKAIPLQIRETAPFIYVKEYFYSYVKFKDADGKDIITDGDSAAPPVITDA